MKNITYITGNPKKSDYLTKYLRYPILHQKIDLDEIQSLDLRKIVKHKIRQAFDIVKGPVVVEDTSLEFKALGGLPGPFIKYFLAQMSYEDVCSLAEGKNRGVTARCVIGYFDGKNETYFEGSMDGVIARKPAGDGAFGFAKIFIPEGFNISQAELNKEDHKTVYTAIKPIGQLRDFLINLDK